MEDGAVEAPAALPSAAQPTPLAAASEFPEVQQVAAAQSARTEAVVATVARMVETVNQIVEAVAAEIAVSPTLASGNGDIRITLKPTVLDGSEIRLTAQSGELTVSIAPATPAAAALAAAALPRLETALAEHAPSFHHVAVVVATARKGKEK
jgi:flagellar hook-length control protein FliK